MHEVCTAMNIDDILFRVPSGTVSYRGSLVDSASVGFTVRVGRIETTLIDTDVFFKHELRIL